MGRTDGWTGRMEWRAGEGGHASSGGAARTAAQRKVVGYAPSARAASGGWRRVGGGVALRAASCAARARLRATRPGGCDTVCTRTNELRVLGEGVRVLSSFFSSPSVVVEIGGPARPVLSRRARADQGHAAALPDRSNTRESTSALRGTLGERTGKGVGRERHAAATRHATRRCAPTRARARRQLHARVLATRRRCIVDPPPPPLSCRSCASKQVRRAKCVRAAAQCRSALALPACLQTKYAARCSLSIAPCLQRAVSAPSARPHSARVPAHHHITSHRIANTPLHALRGPWLACTMVRWSAKSAGPEPSAFTVWKSQLACVALCACSTPHP